MQNSKLTLSVLPQKLGVCRLDKESPIPTWIEGDIFFSITKTDDEPSIACSEDRIPNNIKAEKSWRAFKVEGPLDFSLTGILASLASPLAEAKISIFVISTFDTDYLFVKSNKFDQAVKVLSAVCNIRN